jgi:hypothetical protein
VIRRSGPSEKALVLTRARPGHHCNYAVVVIGILLWDGIQQELATELYDYLRHTLPSEGTPTERRCGWNVRYGGCIMLLNAKFIIHVCFKAKCPWMTVVIIVLISSKLLSFRSTVNFRPSVYTIIMCCRTIA